MTEKIAYCGINCSKCKAYIATKENDDFLRINTSIEWSKLFNRTVLAREINCTGCKSGKDLFTNCSKCSIRREALSNKK